MRGTLWQIGDPVDWYSTVFELIDMRSFSNLWFWIALAVMWSSTSHYVLGVPWDMVVRARKGGGQAMEDVGTLAAINTRRVLYISRESGLLLTGVIFFLLTGSAILGWYYHREFAQAVLLLALPMSVVWVLSVRTAAQIEAGALEGDVLIALLMRHRLLVQIIGMMSIFVTAMWGMYQNMTTSALGG
ncbi:component of SufBCD complex [Roseovarius arcticus]|uniref:component of SufBCD complex n=1 Tax=Roseovarius arcticus TaxID=2547404 RepID=UPI001FE7A00D|nr:component of SufBCD complex [Roseovarius arcticus]